MIVTVTLNPSVDINYKLNSLQLDGVNRVADVSKTAGGKGLNVTRVLRQLGKDVAATGFVGGHLGEFIKEETEKLGARSDFLSVEGETRNCIAVIHDGKQTEILEAGPTIQASDQATFVEAFKEMIDGKKVIAMSGSLPKGLEPDFYKELIDIARAEGLTVILDTSGPALETAVSQGKPTIIKPNETELATLIGAETDSSEQIIAALKTDRFKDIEVVFVTRGSKGAIVKVRDRIYEAVIPKVNVVNPVGSGDSVVAGLCAALIDEAEAEEMIAYGLTMGTLNAMEEQTGYVDVTQVEVLRKEIYVKRSE